MNPIQRLSSLIQNKADYRPISQDCKDQKKGNNITTQPASQLEQEIKAEQISLILKTKVSSLQKESRTLSKTASHIIQKAPVWKTILATTAFCITGIGVGMLLRATIDSFSKIPDQQFKQPLIDPMDRKITIGTAYFNGNDPSRNDYAKIVDETHARYAAKYELLHTIAHETELLANQCKHPLTQQMQNCSAYWLKVPVMKQWLETPKDPNVAEEWRFLIDDDMPITNMDISPYDAIDQLREGTDASVIVVRDPHDWPTFFGGGLFWKLWNSSKIAINGGLWLIRKDSKALDVINKLWETRNIVHDPNSLHCPTLGLCKNQDTLHEQQGMFMVLRDHPNLLDREVSVVSPRDLSSKTRSHIALNTFHNDGCYVRTASDGNPQEGWHSQPFYHNLASYRPDAVWRPGDWMGQTAAVPVSGKILPLENNRCRPRRYNDAADPNIPIVPIRKMRIEEMTQHIVET